MALQLELQITANSTDAKRALAEVDAGIRKVETSAKATQDPISKVTSNITGLAQTQTKLSDSAHMSAEALNKEVMALINADAAAINAAKAQTGLTSSTSTLTTTTAALTAATGLSSAALTVLGGAFAAVTVAGLAWVALLTRSTQHYFEHSAATKDSRDALDQLAKGWGNFQDTIGRAVLGDDFSIAMPVKALNTALQVTGVLIASRIGEIKTLLALASHLPGFGGLAGVAGTVFSNDGRPYVDDGIYTKGGAVPTQQSEIDGLLASPGQLIQRQKEAQRARERADAETQKRLAYLGGINPGYTLGAPGMGTSWIDPFSRAGSIPAPFFGPHVTSGIGSMPGSFVPLPMGPGYSSGPLNMGMFGGASAMAPQFGGGFFGNMFGGSARFGSGLAGTILSSITGGGNILEGAGSFVGGGLGGGLAKMLTTGTNAIGGMAGGALNAFLPGIGSLLGPALSGLVGKLFGPTEYENRQKQLGEDRTAASGMLNQPGLQRQWDSLGGNTPFGFDFLKTQVVHDPTAVKGYLDEMNEKTERLNNAMEKYGITWEELGDKAQQSHIDQMAEDLILDFDVLTQAGADTVFVIEKMGDSINEFVQSAIRTGSEVPAAMRPMLETMVDMGLLTDASGAKIENLEDSGITFSKTMTQGFDAIVEAINRVAIGLGVTIPEAIDEIPRHIPIEVEYTTTGDYPQGPDTGNPNPQYQDEPQYHNGGYVWPRFHRGGEVPAILQTGEFVMSRSAVGRIGAGNLAVMNRGGSIGGGVTVNISGPVIAESYSQMSAFAEMVDKAVMHAMRLNGRQTLTD
jgi:hypothetical protein